MIVFLSVCLISLMGYFALLLYLARAWFKKKTLVNSPGQQNAATLLVPTFNDAAQLQKALAKLQVPATCELLVIDDASDATNRAMLQQLQERHKFTLLENTGEPGKKNALARGIEGAKHGLIIQMDADVEPSPDFVTAMLYAFAEKGAGLCLGLVRMQPGKSLWSKLAALDFLSLQFSGLALAKAGKAIMGNGAALAYKKSTYQKYRHAGKNLSSGDDVFLIQALAKENPEAIKIATHAWVNTAAPEGFSEFLAQRVRWGSKTMAFPSVFAIVVAFVVAAANWSVVLLLIAAFFNAGFYALFLMLLGLKLVLEYLLLANFARQTRQIEMIKHFYLALLYPFYIVLTTILILLAKDKNTWKGRPVKI